MVSKGAVLRKGAIFAPALFVVVASAALAAATGITPLDTAETNIVKIVQGLAAFAAVFLMGILVWDFVQHRNIARSIFELLGVLVLGLIAVNANTVAGIFGLNGALF